MVAQGYRVNPKTKHVVRDVRGDSDPARSIFAIDDYKKRIPLLNQRRQIAFQRIASWSAHNVAQKEDSVAHALLGNIRDPRLPNHRHLNLTRKFQFTLNATRQLLRPA